MRFHKQSTTIPILNFDEFTEHNSESQQQRHGRLLPNSIRALVCGPSNCGKTNALLALIVDPNGLRFENIYVYSKSLNQPKYKFLEELINPLDGVNYHAFSENEQVLTPSDAQSNSVMIFDDVACEKQDNIRAYFCMGRHNNIDSFYLTQTYARVPKHLIRDNVNFLILFKQDDMNLKHVYDDHVNTDMSYSQFREICSKCWNKLKHAFVVIDKDSELNNGRYRHGFDCYVSVSE